MRGRTMLLFLIALLLAGGTAVLVRSRLQQPVTSAAAPPRPVAAPRRSVLVARTAIERGQILKSADLAWQPWPDTAPTQAYIVAGEKPAAALAGWVAREPFVVGEPIIRAKIIAPGDHGFLAAVLRPGMRAVSVPVSATSGISGFVFPGDHVDVLVTHSLPGETTAGTQHEHKAAETILRNIRVIAVDQHLDSKPGDAMLAHTATLEVTPKQSEIIALASDLGQLSLSLRSLVGSSDGRLSDGALDAAADTFTLDSDVSRLIAADQVTIIRGGSRSTSPADAQAAARTP